MPIKNGFDFSLIGKLYLPWVIACLFYGDPIISYYIAWAGSFYIFYQTLFSPSRFLLPDLPAHKQIMRPIFLQQLIFAGFMCSTSIFYFLSTLGYQFFEKINNVNPAEVRDRLMLIAECQRLSLLAHASLVTGILLIQQKHLISRPGYVLNKSIARTSWISKVCIIAFGLAIAMERIPGLFQFSIGLYNVAIFCGAVLFVEGITHKKLYPFTIGGTIFIINIINSTLTGYKEHIIVNFIILGCLLFPYYRKAVLVFSLPLIAVLFYILPTYAKIMRAESWGGEVSASEARSTALEYILSEQDNLAETNWSFLTDRLSEINMFTSFVESTPKDIPYYGFEILANSITVIIPRALWKDKPITEALAMERVYAAGIVDLASSVSAKTRPVVDGYLSAGAFGVFVYMFFLGMLSQKLCNLAENLFGGYEIGAVIFYNGFFQLMWRGETIEFLLNSVFWSFVMMLIVFQILKSVKYLQVNNKLH